jgi:hypothetical protein
MTHAGRVRALRRLSVRGTLDVKLDMRAKVCGRETHDHGTTTWYSDVDTPVWVVSLRRPYRGPGSPHWFYDMIGWNDIRVEHEDLDLAIGLALERSEPPLVFLDERVYEHVGFQRAAELADQFQVYAEAV